MIDEMHDSAKKNGAIGGKVSGAGAGFFFVFYADADRSFDVIEAMSRFEGRFVGYQFHPEGVEGWNRNTGAVE